MDFLTVFQGSERQKTVRSCQKVKNVIIVSETEIEILKPKDTTRWQIVVVV